MTTITCRCGAVELEFEASHDLFRLQCCCHDCSAALWYADKRGGPAAPPHQLVDNSWFPNDFRIARGEDQIGAFKNFEQGDTTRFYCKTCWTILFGDHPVYEKKVLVTAARNYREYDGLKGATLMPPQARHFMKDLSAESANVLPPWSGDSAHTYAGVADNLMARFPEMQARGNEGGEMNAQILLARIGKPFVPTNEPRLGNGPPTLMQQNAEPDDR